MIYSANYILDTLSIIISIFINLHTLDFKLNTLMIFEIIIIISMIIFLKYVLQSKLRDSFK